MEIHRQPFLQEELKKRIMAGKRGDLLPTAAELAAEYGVNIKTVNKVLNQLAASGLLERKRRTGTVILGNCVRTAGTQAAHRNRDPRQLARCTG